MIDLRGGVGLGEDFASPRDFVVAYGEVVYVGVHLIVLQAPDNNGKTIQEWVHDKEVLICTTGHDVVEFLREQYHFPAWATGSLGDDLEIGTQDKKYRAFYVFCPKHGCYDNDELCWCCYKEAVDVINSN